MFLVQFKTIVRHLFLLKVIYTIQASMHLTWLHPYKLPFNISNTSHGLFPSSAKNLTLILCSKYIRILPCFTTAPKWRASSRFCYTVQACAAKPEPGPISGFKGETVVRSSQVRSVLQCKCYKNRVCIFVTFFQLYFASFVRVPYFFLLWQHGMVSKTDKC